MLVKLAGKKILDNILTEVDINGTKHPIRWEIDDSGKAVLATAKVDGLGYNKAEDLYKVEVKNNVDVFYSDFTVLAGASGNVTFLELPKTFDNVGMSEYKSFDITIKGLTAHEFAFTDNAGFRTVDGAFGEFSFYGTSYNLASISDVIYKNSTQSSSANHRYLIAIGVKVVQSAFKFNMTNKSTLDQNYHAEIRLYR